MIDAQLTLIEAEVEMAVPFGPKNAVLLIEDNEIIAGLLSITLKNLGLQVICCHSGAQGLREFFAQPHRFALVLSDCKLPDADGREICHQMRLAVAGLPVLLTSGAIIDEMAPLTLGQFVQFVRKPYATSEIIVRVRSLLTQTVRSSEPIAAGFV